VAEKDVLRKVVKKNFWCYWTGVLGQEVLKEYNAAKKNEGRGGGGTSVARFVSLGKEGAEETVSFIEKTGGKESQVGR